MKKSIMVLATLIASTSVHAEPLMDRDQYIDYAAQQHCINQEYWDQPAKQEEALLELEKKMGINEDNYLELDDLAMEYGQDTAVQEAVEARAREMCPPKI